MISRKLIYYKIVWEHNTALLEIHCQVAYVGERIIENQSAFGIRQHLAKLEAKI